MVAVAGRRNPTAASGARSLAPHLAATIVPRDAACLKRRGGRVAEGARLESVFTGNRNVGSNPTPSAKAYIDDNKALLLDGAWRPKLGRARLSQGSGILRQRGSGAWR